MKKILSIFATLIFTFSLHAQSTGKAKYIFLFIGDGMGINQVFLTQEYNSYFKKDSLIFLKKQWKFGLMQTQCIDSNKITDSGAGGTAIACGSKTNYGSIGEYDAQPLESIAEYLSKQNFKIGIITSVPINHATPACFYGHEPTRRNYDNLTDDLIASKFNFFAGGGFLIGNADSTKKIYKNFNEILKKLSQSNFKLVLNPQELSKLNASQKKPVMVVDTLIRNVVSKIPGIYSDEKNSLPYAIDFPEYDLQLANYQEKAQELLMNETGFFIMLEGGKIDWACHSNDALTSIFEVNAFNEAIKKAYEFYLLHPENTLIIITADHETGGLSLGSGMDEHSNIKTNNYAFYIGKLNQQKKSNLFTDVALINKAQEETQIGWNTNEHTNAPVGIWAIGAGSENFTGIIQNNEIKRKIIKAMK